LRQYQSRKDLASVSKISELEDRLPGIRAAIARAVRAGDQEAELYARAVLDETWSEYHQVKADTYAASGERYRARLHKLRASQVSAEIEDKLRGE
jgi:hypothetical protein